MLAKNKSSLLNIALLMLSSHTCVFAIKLKNIFGCNCQSEASQSWVASLQNLTYEAESCSSFKHIIFSTCLEAVQRRCFPSSLKNLLLLAVSSEKCEALMQDACILLSSFWFWYTNVKEEGMTKKVKTMESNPCNSWEWEIIHHSFSLARDEVGGSGNFPLYPLCGPLSAVRKSFNSQSIVGIVLL